MIKNKKLKKGKRKMLKRGRKLNRTASHRSALLSNLASAFVINKQIITTQPKAKELRGFAERLITYAKKDSLHGRRLILKKIKGRNSKKIADILIHDLAPNYKDRSGGYTRIIKLDNRKNDNAIMCIIEFVDLKIDNDTTVSDESEESTE